LEETFEADLENDEYRYGQKDDAPDEGSVGVPGRKTKETTIKKQYHTCLNEQI